MTTAEARYRELEARVATLEALLSTLNGWMNRALETAGGAAKSWEAAANLLAESRTPPSTAGAPARPTTVVVGDDDSGLDAWVDWLVVAYELGEAWPTCWGQHPGLVANLRGLRRWHRALTGELVDEPSAVCVWHNALHLVVKQAVRPVASRCLTSHRTQSAELRQRP